MQWAAALRPASCLIANDCSDFVQASFGLAAAVGSNFLPISSIK
jgi:hypothetical protein